MTLQTSGAITLADIQTEFGGTNPISLSEYYAGGTYVPSGTTGTNGAVPSSGAISLWHFYGTSQGLSATMTVGSNAYTYLKVTYYVDGFIGTGSAADFTAPTIGSMSADTFKTSTVKALYWIHPGTGHNGTIGNVRLELSGDHTADSGFVTDVKVAGSSLGTIGTPTYNATSDTTIYGIGTDGSWTNPFGTSGTKAIVII